MARRYLASMGAAFVLVLVAAALLSAYVDPYRVFDLPGHLDDASPRPRAEQQVRLTKVVGVQRVHPRTLVIGNSRAEIGLDPQSAEWPSSWQPVYNAAIPGTDLSTGIAMLEHALRVGKVAHVVVGLEFLDFLVAADEPSQEDPADADGAATESTRWQAARTLLTLDSILDAALTLQARGDPYAADITARGFNPLRDYRLAVRREGYGALFEQRNRENARSFALLPHDIFERGGRSSPSWRQLERLLALAKDHDVRVIGIIYPYHAQTLELFRAAGLWEAFEAWKARLAEVMPARAEVGGEACALWDFSGYHAYASEPVPARGVLGVDLAWYWEAGHFKSTLGERMLQRIGGGQPEPAFGRCLTPATAPDDRAAIRAERGVWAANNPDAVASLAALWAEAKRRAEAERALARTPR